MGRAASSRNEVRPTVTLSSNARFAWHEEAGGEGEGWYRQYMPVFGEGDEFRGVLTPVGS